MRMSAVVLAGALAAAGCGGADDQSALEFRQAPYIGVSCRTANSIRCDRVGLAVWLKENPAHLSASIEGRPVKLRLMRGTESRWEGFLQPAGLLEGPLKVRAHGGRWNGAPPVYARVRLGSGAGERTVRVRVSPGWG